MHEFAIGEWLVKTVSSELERIEPVPKLLSVRVVVGRLRQVVPDNIEFAYRSLAKGTNLEGSILEIVSVPVLAECRKCRQREEIKDVFFQCSACGSGDLEILGGKELYLDGLVVGDGDAED